MRTHQIRIQRTDDVPCVSSVSDRGRFYVTVQPVTDKQTDAEHAR